MGFFPARAELASLVACFLGATGCASTNAASPEELGSWQRPAEGMRDSDETAFYDSLRLNELQVKGSHNSYHARSAWLPIPQWQYDRPPLAAQVEDQRVRAFELDIHLDDAHGSIRVFHVPDFDDATTCSLLADCLTVLRSWSDEHPLHAPLFTQLEIKDEEFGALVDWPAYARLLDETIRDVWPRERLLTPDDVQGSASSLRTAVMTSGWPTLKRMRGKMVFFLDDRGAFHDAYTRSGTSTRKRILFPDSRTDEPIAAFVIANGPLAEIPATVARGFMVRTRVDAFPAPADMLERRMAALGSGAQILSTDYPDDSYGVAAFDLPRRAEFRCNPISAAERCRARTSVPQ